MHNNSEVLTNDSTNIKPDNKLLLSALVGGIVSCIVPLTLGILNGWSAARIILYTILITFWFVLSQAPRMAWGAALVMRLKLFLMIMGFLTFVLHIVSANSELQPVAFLIPFVYAALGLNRRGTLIVGLIYMVLVPLGLRLGGAPIDSSFFFGIMTYTSILTLVYAMVVVWKQEQQARIRADQLAHDLQQQHNQVQQLAQLIATLTHNLDLSAVLSKIASATHTLTQADAVRIWLPETNNPDTLQLAQSLPAQLTEHTSAPELAVLAQAGASQIALPLSFEERRIGMLEIERSKPLSETDMLILQPFVDAAAIAIRNAQHYAQAQESAALGERNRLARELHDTIAQGLTATVMQLEAAQRSIERDPGRSRMRLTRAIELSRATLNDVRQSVWMLADPLTSPSELPATLQALSESFCQRTNIPTTYTHTGDLPGISHTAASQVYRITQEALHNIEKHAQASCVSLQSGMHANGFELTIMDNGKGFDPELPSASAGGFGILGLHERARLAGALLDITSTKSVGTCIHLIITAIKHD